MKEWHFMFNIVIRMYVYVFVYVYVYGCEDVCV